MSPATRADLYSSAHVAPGYYVIDGEPGDMRGRVIGGPFQTQIAAEAHATAKLRGGRRFVISQVMVTP